MKRATMSLVFFLSMTAVLPGCKPKKTDNSTNVCKQIYGARRRCNLISEGLTPCDFNELFAQNLEQIGQTEEGRCELACYVNASCEELTNDQCGDDEPTPVMDACMDKCVAKYGFHCADGSETFPEDYQCDGEVDCNDGSDEQGCPAGTSFQCADGSQTIAGDLKCDGFEDCADGSDEQGCPPGTSFQCADGSQTIAGDLKCDGFEDCTDASDEPADCPASVRFSCADGSGTIPIWSRCDMHQDCPDGSDEADCSQPLPCP